jgi:hypothetical protein
MQSLAGLYIARGYPSDIVYKWLRDNYTKRWTQRLNESKRKQEPEHVLVLKSSFNTAWDYFNAKKLGDTMINFWRQWCAAAEQGRLPANHLPMLSGHWEGLTGMVDEGLCSSFSTPAGFHPVPDIRKLEVMNSRWLVSRKRTNNLFDVSTLWKKTVLTALELETLDPITGPSLQPVEEVAMSESVAPSQPSRTWRPPTDLSDTEDDPWIQAFNEFGLAGV